MLLRRLPAVNGSSMRLLGRFSEAESLSCGCIVNGVDVLCAGQTRRIYSGRRHDGRFAIAFYVILSAILAEASDAEELEL
jgi:hypothetical protein